MEKIKIKKWSELDGRRSGDYSLHYIGKCNALFIKETDQIVMMTPLPWDKDYKAVLDSHRKECARISLDRADKDDRTILAVLKLYGFDAEFAKPHITRWEYAKKHEAFNDFNRAFDKYCKLKQKDNHERCDDCYACFEKYQLELVDE